METHFDAEQVSASEYRIFVQDKSGSLSGYNHVYFPREGVEKLGLLKKTNHGSMSFFVLVSPEKLTAIGRSVRRGGGGEVLTYMW